MLISWLLKKVFPKSKLRTVNPDMSNKEDPQINAEYMRANRKPIPFTIFHPADDSINTECRTDILFKEVFCGCSYDSYHDVLSDSRYYPSDQYLKTGLRLTTNGDVYLYDNKYYQLHNDTNFRFPSSIHIQPRLKSLRIHQDD